MSHKWVVCHRGSGYLYEHGVKEKHETHFPVNSVGLIKQIENDEALIWLIGTNTEWFIPIEGFRELDVSKTGDKYKNKICNICHCLKPVSDYAANQTNKHGAIRRPSCARCRSDIDKRAPKSSQAKRMEKNRPAIGSPFKCPICRKRSIVGITAKIVADHDHHTGDIRDFICDSCNTGLGRFKNGENYLMNAVRYLEKKDKLR